MEHQERDRRFPSSSKATRDHDGGDVSDRRHDDHDEERDDLGHGDSVHFDGDERPVFRAVEK